MKDEIPTLEVPVKSVHSRRVTLDELRTAFEEAVSEHE